MDAGSVDFAQDAFTLMKNRLIKTIKQLIAVYFKKNGVILVETSFVAFIFQLSPESLPGMEKLNAATEQLVDTYKTMNKSVLSAFLQTIWLHYQSQVRPAFQVCARKFIVDFQSFFDAVRAKNDPLLDYTLKNKMIKETLQMDIQGIVTDIPDTDVSNVSIIGPDHEGTCFLHMSQADRDNFEKFASTTITFLPTDETVAHALMITYNQRTQSCYIYDPNGGIDKTNFSDAKISGFVKAVHRGLLRPLLAEPFAVSFQTGFEGLQSHEKMLSKKLISQLQDDTYSDLFEVETRSKLIRYLIMDGGFCKTLSVFMVIDNYQTKLVCYSLIKRAFVHNDEQARMLIKYFVKYKWLNRFCVDLGITYYEDEEPPKAMEDFLMEMALPIFVRLLAQYFLDQNALGAHLGQKEPWWPSAAQRRGQDFHTAAETLFTLITPKGPLLDFKKHFQNAKTVFLKSSFPFKKDGTKQTVFQFAVETQTPIPFTREQLQ